MNTNFHRRRYTTVAVNDYAKPGKQSSPSFSPPVLDQAPLTPQRWGERGSSPAPLMPARLSLPP